MAGQNLTASASSPTASSKLASLRRRLKCLGLDCLELPLCGFPNPLAACEGSALSESDASADEALDRVRTVAGEVGRRIAPPH